MAIFYSYVKLPEGRYGVVQVVTPDKLFFSITSFFLMGLL